MGSKLLHHSCDFVREIIYGAKALKPLNVETPSGSNIFVDGLPNCFSKS